MTTQMEELGYTTGLERQEKWDRRFLDIAERVSTWSKDPSTQVGAVLVKDGVIVGTGYNGFPRGVEDSDERYNDRPTKYAMVVHAELNAILQAGDRAKGATIYVYPSFGAPSLCENCAKAVIQAGVVRTVGFEPNIDEERAARWAESLAIALTMCDEAGVQVDLLPEEDTGE
jgi:dCMP deaminase